VDSWDLNDLEVQPHQPQVLDSEAEGRAIVIQLPAGEQLQEHQVHERAWLLVTDGEIEVADSGGDSFAGKTGFLAIFDPRERRQVTAKSDARLLLILSPWPGEGHPSQRGA
jgi:redox-sensitive bicupin YhaK (pirin superfamily)